MILANNKESKICCFDIETPVGCFDIGIYNPDTKEWKEFEISKYRNDLYAFVKFYKNNDFDYWVSFNGISFDHQVLQYIVDHSQHWYDLTGHEIAARIAAFGGRIIENQNYNLPSIYKEYQFPVKAIDLFKIHHFDNEAKMTSLKWCEFMMNLDVEVMDAPFSEEHFTLEMIKDLKLYRKHDVLATMGLLLLTLGEINKLREFLKEEFDIDTTLEELEQYKGKNKIQDRMDVENETGLKCLNFSDVKIGEEWNKLDYKKAEKITNDSILFNRKIKAIWGQKFKAFFPKTMDFKTLQLQEFIKKLGEEYVKPDRKGSKRQEFKIKIGHTTYTIAKGGIHSCEKDRVLKPMSGYLLRDADVQSQYPNSILKLRVYPPHLKSTIIDQFEGKVLKRIEYKAKGNKLKKQGLEAESRPFISVQEMLKLCLNGGYYGKLNQPGSFLQYPEGYLRVCMGNQIEILMLIEMMEMAGFQVVSGNTDGIVVMFPSAEEKIYNKICADWETKVGNNIIGKLEYTDLDGMWQQNINNYIGKKADGSVKRKGSFKTIEFLLNENKSKRIIALALDKYFIEKIDPRDFIPTHKNIYDFCIGKKAYGNLHYEEIISGYKEPIKLERPSWDPHTLEPYTINDTSQEKVIVHKKLIRYYVSNNGHVFMKRGINNEGGLMNNHCEALDKEYPWMKQPVLTYFNKAFKKEKFEDFDVNYSFYIMEALEKIDNIEKTKKARNYADTFKTKQLTIF